MVLKDYGELLCVMRMTLALVSLVNSLFQGAGRGEEQLMKTSEAAT